MIQWLSSILKSLFLKEEIFTESKVNTSSLTTINTIIVYINKIDTIMTPIQIFLLGGYKNFTNDSMKVHFNVL